jgi:hypothetical protein
MVLATAGGPGVALLSWGLVVGSLPGAAMGGSEAAGGSGFSRTGIIWT